MQVENTGGEAGKESKFERREEGRKYMRSKKYEKKGSPVCLTWGSNQYANQMLTMLTWHNIHKKANWRSNTTRKKKEKSDGAAGEKEKKEAVEMLLRCSHEPS